MLASRWGESSLRSFIEGFIEEDTLVLLLKDESVRAF